MLEVATLLPEGCVVDDAGTVQGWADEDIEVGTSVVLKTVIWSDSLMKGSAYAESTEERLCKRAFKCLATKSLNSG
jgi:hypothetical protein